MAAKIIQKSRNPGSCGIDVEPRINNAVLKTWPADCERGINAVNGGSELKIERALVLRRHALPIWLLPHLDLAYLVPSPLDEAHFRPRILWRVVKETDRQQHLQAIGQ